MILDSWGRYPQTIATVLEPLDGPALKRLLQAHAKEGEMIARGAGRSYGDSALAGKTQLVEGDDNIILQTYPAGGLVLGDVSTLNVMAYAMDAGDAVTAQLWVKDQDGVWRDSGANAITEGGVQLSVDVSDYQGIQGFGVRFQGAVNSASESKYFIDNVIFE